MMPSVFLLADISLSRPTSPARHVFMSNTCWISNYARIIINYRHADGTVTVIKIKTQNSTCYQRKHNMTFL
jgi:hypothetical protein